MSSGVKGIVPEPSQVDELAPAQAYPKGVQLFREGVLLNEVLLVRAGVVKLARTAGDGRESIIELAFRETWLGAASVIVNRPSPVSAITCTEAMITRITADEFRRQLREAPTLSLRVHEAHARELNRQMGWIDELASLSSLERLKLVMRRFIATLPRQTSDRGVRLNVPLRHWELARLIAVSPEHLSRLFRKMEREGIIERSKGWVIVSDMMRLGRPEPDDDPDDVLSRDPALSRSC
jgi:CRP/FNR family transcriptional regulator, cyclic AMP receptor protein